MISELFLFLRFGKKQRFQAVLTWFIRGTFEKLLLLPRVKRGDKGISTHLHN